MGKGAGMEYRTVTVTNGMGSCEAICPWCGQDLLVYDEAVGTKDICHCGGGLRIVAQR